MGYEERLYAKPHLRLVGQPRAARPRPLPLSRIGTVGGTARGRGRVVSLSDDGLVLATRMHPSLGEQLTVDLSPSCTLTGEVIWVQPGQCGLRLLATINSAALLGRLAVERAHSPRRRWWPERTAVMHSALGLQFVRLRDVSRKEARIVHDGRFAPGMSVKLQLAPGIERPGVLSWSRDGIADVALCEALDAELLGQVKRAQRDDVAARKAAGSAAGNAAGNA